MSEQAGLAALPESFLAAPRAPTVRRAINLGGSAGFWRILAGGIDLFAVRRVEGAAYGPWHPLGRLGPGEVFGGVAPLPADLEDLDLLAHPLPGTRLQDEPALETPGDTAAIDAWLVTLIHMSGATLRPREVFQLGSLPGDAEVKAGTALCAAGPLIWLEATGRLSYAGQALAKSSTPIALTERHWVRIDEDCILRAATSDELAARGLLPAAMRRATEEALRGLVETLLRKEQAAVAALGAREVATDQRLKLASAELAATLHPGRSPGQEAQAVDALVRCCLRVAADYGITLNKTLPSGAHHAWLDTGDIGASIERLARASRVAMRRATLPDGWWRADHGSFVGVRDGEPVSLIRGRRGYKLVGADGSEVPVNADIATALAPVGYLFYRPLPAKPINGLELLRFALLGNKRELATVLLAAGAGAVLALATPIVSSAIFDSIVPMGEFDQLGQIAVVLIGAAVASLGFSIAQSLSQLRAQGRIDATVQAAVWDRLLNLPASFFQDYEVGDLANRAMGINSLSSQLTGVTMSSLFGGTFSIVSFGMMLYYQWQLALVGLAFVLITVGGSSVFALLQRSQQREQLALRGELSARIFQYFSGIAKLRSAGSEVFAFWDWVGRFARDIGFQRRSGIIVYTQGLFSYFMMLAFQVLSLALFAFVLGKISLGYFVAFNSAFGQFFSGITSLAGAAVTLYGLAPLYERTRPILDAAPEVDGSKMDPGELTGQISVDNVSFSYPGSDRAVLDGVSLTIRPGEFVGIVGPSGAGKSTLLRLLLCFDQPTRGKVAFGGYDLATLDPMSMRRQLGVVLQNGQILPGSIFDNIVANGPYGLDDAWMAARMAGMESDIRAMPMGMQTMISEGAATFSGGQKQRLMIARAVIRRPRILFLDEATSALDNETQAMVTAALDTLKSTRIVVAHRLSTIVKADQIVVLQGGKIVQRGRFEELAATPGPFAELARRQIA